LNEENAFFILEFTEQVPKSRASLQYAYERSEEITRKMVFALRLLTFGGVFSDYRGFRMLGQQSAFTMNLMEYPDERIDWSSSGDLVGKGETLQRFLPALINRSLDSLAVVEIRLGDALRRGRRSPHDPDVKRKADLDRLFDYIQALESLVPERGSDAIRLGAAVLLSRSSGVPASQIYDFFKLVYKVRDEVMHGRLAAVLARQRKGEWIVDIQRLQSYIHQLAVLGILNDGLSSLAKRLQLGETISLRTLANL
jgi:hypothetical protein